MLPRPSRDLPETLVGAAQNDQLAAGARRPFSRAQSGFDDLFQIDGYRARAIGADGKQIEMCGVKAELGGAQRKAVVR